MKNTVLILFAFSLSVSSAYAQDSTIIEQYRVGINGRVVPKKDFLYLELEGDMRMTENYSLGLKLGRIHISSSLTGGKFKRTYATGGITFHLLKRRNFFIDPSAHLMYLKFIRVTDGGYFDGGGVMGSLRIGYSFGRFGIGIKGFTSFNIGATKLPNLNGKIFDYYFDEFQYGFHLSYKI